MLININAYRACNATYENINSLYIVNRNLVEQQFLGKKSFYTVFGHMPISINKVYNIWSYIMKKELQTNLNNKYSAQEFNWDSSMWIDYYSDKSATTDSIQNLIDEWKLNVNVNNIQKINLKITTTTI